MINIWTLVTITAVYLLSLFLVAFWGDKHLRNDRLHPEIYSLGLGIHCTSWAYFGTTTQSLLYGWAVIPTYLGMIIALLFGYSVMRKIAKLCQRNHIGSLAELVGLQHQHTHTIAAIITLLSFIGVVPYIALQLDAVSQSIRVISDIPQAAADDIGFYIVVVMSIFAILFGTQTLNLREKHPGLMLTIAFESVFKLLCLTIVGGFICFFMFDGLWDVVAQAAQSPAGRDVLYADASPWVYISHVILGICSLFVLPRQFHMNFVELNGEAEMRTAKWMLPLYLLGMSFFVLPIALAGSVYFEGQNVDSDMFVLALPVAQGNAVISAIGFIGGLSAATSMIIVATLALGIMIANNIFTPLWLSFRIHSGQSNTMKLSHILLIRRITVVIILFIAYFYHAEISRDAPLVKSGIVAISLLAQTFPVLILSIYWRKRSTTGVICALLAGTLSWAYLVLYPNVLASYFHQVVPSDATLGGGFITALLINTLTYMLVTQLTGSRKHSQKPGGIQPESGPQLTVKISDLLQLTQRLLSPHEQEWFTKQLDVPTGESSSQSLASNTLLQKSERLIASHVGAPSARLLLSAISNKSFDNFHDLVGWAEEASQNFHFNHEVLQSSVQHIHQGISVIDQDQKLLAWNDTYVSMFNYPEGFLQAGISLRNVLLYNASRGLLGTLKDVDTEIDKRVTFIRQGRTYKHIRRQKDGKVIELNGSPLPGGGYVTTFSDITEYVNIQEQLEASKQDLERRVEARTSELQEARQDAIAANESKTKFLAAAGHDLMQPFNAAALFANMLEEKTRESHLHSLSEGVVNSLNNAESLLSMLLDMTKLESGVLHPHYSVFALDELLAPLVKDANIIAREKSLNIRYVKSNVCIHSDKQLLGRIVQNLLSNAVRYTTQGSVLIGTRKKSDNKIELWVVDTGKGIAVDKQALIFNEFQRLDDSDNPEGLGLGLTIVERISALLDLDVSVQSIVSKGTRFTITLPVAGQQITALTQPLSPHESNQTSPNTLFNGEPVLVIENDKAIAQAMEQLLSDWGACVTHVTSYEQAAQRNALPPTLVFVDYHLDCGENGIDTIAALRQLWGHDVPAILNTADRSDDVQDKALNAGIHYLPKPIKPAAVKRLIKQNKLLIRAE